MNNVKCSLLNYNPEVNSLFVFRFYNRRICQVFSNTSKEETKFVKQMRFDFSKKHRKIITKFRFLTLKVTLKPDMVTHPCKPNTREAKVGGLPPVQG